MNSVDNPRNWPVVMLILVYVLPASASFFYFVYRQGAIHKLAVTLNRGRAAGDFSAPFRIVDAQQNGVEYAYSPSIIYENGVYHVFFCSVGANGAWDYIRYVYSADGGATWSTSQIKLTASPKTGRDIAACDPNVIYWQGYYYMFYSSYDAFAQTVVQVARSPTIDGTDAVYTDSGRWVINPDGSDPPKEIIRAKIAGSEAEIGYGAGQTTEVIYNGKIRIYYTDTSTNPTRKSVLWMMESADPVSWNATTAQKINFPGYPNAWHTSEDIRYDNVKGRFVMYYLDGGHSVNSSLRYTYSTDGITWSNDYQLLDKDNFPNFANNAGFASDRNGYLLSGSRIIFGFAAPKDYNSVSDTWGRWDLYGIWVPSNPNITSRPIGSFDGVDAGGNAVGWAVDPDNTLGGVAIHFYTCSNDRTPISFVGDTWTDKIRTDVNSQLSITGAHGFYYPIPGAYRDGKSYQICAYAIDNEISSVSTNLPGNPQTFTIQPTPTSTPTLTPVNRLPAGWLDGVDVSGNAIGWAYDPDHSESGVDVHFYACQSDTTPVTFVGNTGTTKVRGDVNGALGITR